MSEEIINDLARFSTDPYGFVMWAFPWGEPGTELANRVGPETWQKTILRKLGMGLITVHEAILLAVSSGHGIGKSALCAWIVWWAFSTRANTRGVVTANTENQLKTKTWVEIAKWYRLFIAREYFKCTATAIFARDEEVSREWRIDIVPWSERNTEAFAGLHNQGNRILVIFDEASAIPDVIWEVTEGALTDADTEIIWIAFGNPTKNNGRFHSCFDDGEFAHRWYNLRVDSREVSFTNKEQIARWEADYGTDSDFFRVRVRGIFPKADSDSFISREIARGAVNRVIEPQTHAPLIMGVDPARYGTNLSTIVFRRGRDASGILPISRSGIGVTQLAALVAQNFNLYDADAIMVDGAGVGGGVVDVLTDMGFPVYDVQAAATAPGFHDGTRYQNWRAECWGLMREDLAYISILDKPPGFEVSLVDQLCAPSYKVKDNGLILLESKESMRARGIASPDYADALSLTYAYPIPKKVAFAQKKETRRDPYDVRNIYHES